MSDYEFVKIVYLVIVLMHDLNLYDDKIFR